MIQIRKLRSFTPKGESEPKKYDKQFEPDILVDSLADLFANLEKHVSKIQENDRWNCYYTLGHSTPGEKRAWLSQDVIPFDIDGITVLKDDTFSPEYLDAFFSVVPVDRAKCITIFTGNGFQVVVKTHNTITNKDFFKTNAKFYKLVCDKIASEFEKRGLAGKPDTVVFSANRLFRLPGTVNRKPDRPERKARILEGKLEAQELDLVKVSGAPAEAEQVSEKILKRMAIDERAVESGCNFLKWTKANPEHVTEPQWYAALSILGRFESGSEKAHEYSREHPSYAHGGTEAKLQQALSRSGPRTCQNIDAVWSLCSECPNFGKVTSPITLRSRDFIATRASGFYSSDDKGKLIPAFDDLCKYFAELHSYKTDASNGAVYVYNGKKYEQWSDTQLRSFAHQAFDPKPKDYIVNEFCSWVRRTNLVEHQWFESTTYGRINFANGILDHTSGELSAHSAELGFLYVLPFAYDSAARSPFFDAFLSQVTCDDLELQQVLLEFVGYALCDTEYWLQKALLLVGEGSNGKSTFLRIVEALAGQGNTCGLSLNELQNETFRSFLEGKLLNVAEEMPSYGWKNTELFKKLLGGSITTRRLYQDLGMMRNNTKLVFACNEIPPTADLSDGLFRRLTIVPFNAKFELGVNADTKILAKVTPELSGVFNRVYDAYKKLVARGAMTDSVAVRQEVKNYREDVDTIGEWVKDHIEWTIDTQVGTENFVDQNVLFSEYTSHAIGAHEKPVTRNYFMRQLKRHIPNFKDRKRRHRVGKNLPYVIFGVKLKSYSNGKDHSPKASKPGAYHEEQPAGMAY